MGLNAPELALFLVMGAIVLERANSSIVDEL
jgi:hypothetical protein